MKEMHLSKREVAATINNLAAKKIIDKPARRYAHIRIADHAVVQPMERPVFKRKSKRKNIHL